jgi:hypothetical protein
MKGNGRLALMIGAVVVLGFAAPAQAAVSAGNILAAAATVDNGFRQELPVQMTAADIGAQPQASQTGETQAPSPPVAVASSDDTPAPRTAPVTAGDDHSLWDETSLIGKVFIGFGTLLTIASAARMFMA